MTAQQTDAQPFRAGDNMRRLDPQENVTAVRQQHRNVFAERCRLAGLRVPDDSTMLAWWPGTRSVFG
jgi:hypothetical protein